MLRKRKKGQLRIFHLCDAPILECAVQSYSRLFVNPFLYNNSSSRDDIGQVMCYEEPVKCLTVAHTDDGRPTKTRFFSDKRAILIDFLTICSFFAKLIWTYYSKPKLVPWGALFGQRCQLCETLMKRKVWGSFLGAQGAHFCDLGRKKAPSDLTFYKV